MSRFLGHRLLIVALMNLGPADGGRKQKGPFIWSTLYYRGWVAADRMLDAQAIISWFAIGRTYLWLLLWLQEVLRGHSSLPRISHFARGERQD